MTFPAYDRELAVKANERARQSEQQLADAWRDLLKAEQRVQDLEDARLTMVEDLQRAVHGYSYAASESPLRVWQDLLDAVARARRAEQRVQELEEALVALRDDQVAWSNRDYIIRAALDRSDDR